jgi:hypothetical protein
MNNKKTRTMARLIFTAGAVLLMFFASAQDKLVSDPNAQVRKVEKFEGVNVSGAIELYISQGSQAVAVSASDKDLVDEIVTEVKGGILYIRFKSKKSWWSDQWNTTGKKFKAYVSAEKINFVSLSGSGNIRIEGTLKAPELAIQLSGSGNVSGNIDTDDLDLRQSGSGNIKLTGNADKAEFSCSGSGNVICADLVTDNCRVTLSGSGNAEVNVNKELSASISGSGNIRYRGNGNLVNASTAGSGKIRKI